MALVHTSAIFVSTYYFALYPNENLSPITSIFAMMKTYALLACFCDVEL